MSTQRDGGKSCAGSRGSVAKTCSAVPGSRHPSNVADRAGLVATSLLKNRSDRVHTFAGTPGPSGQPVGLNGCVRQETLGMRRHHELFHPAASDRSQRGKSQDERKEERILPRSAKEPHKLSRVLIPRRARTLPVRGATANFTCSTPLRDRSDAAVDGVSPEHRVR